MKHLFQLTLFIIGFSFLALASCKNEKPIVPEITKQATVKKPTQVTKKPVSNASHDSGDHLNTGGMQWTTFDAIAESGSKPNGKMYLIDVYTDWCGWCKVMDKKTFTDPAVQAYLDEHFNIVKFDAEQKDPLTFKGRIYEWQSGGRNGYNQLAKELLGTRMSYPTMVYLDENMNKIKAIPGYKKPDQLLGELKNLVES